MYLNPFYPPITIPFSFLFYDCPWKNCLYLLLSISLFSHEHIPIRFFFFPHHHKLLLLELPKTSLIDSKSKFHFLALILLDLWAVFDPRGHSLFPKEFLHLASRAPHSPCFPSALVLLPTSHLRNFYHLDFSKTFSLNFIINYLN